MTSTNGFSAATLLGSIWRMSLIEMNPEGRAILESASGTGTRKSAMAVARQNARNISKLRKKKRSRKKELHLGSRRLRTAELDLT